MKKSINIWSFSGGSLAVKMNLAAEAGFSGFEIDLTEEGPVSLDPDRCDFAAVRKAAASAGVEISGLATGLYWGANGASADEKVRAKAAHILERQIECAAALGLDAILMVPAAVGVDFIPGAEVVPYDLALERSLTLIQGAIPLASKHRVKICIENVWNKFLLSPIEMRDMIASFGSEYVAAYFDVGNALGVGYPEHWISILDKKIARVHFKDYRRAVGTVDGFCDLLSGDVDWAAVMSALRGVGYDGWVAAEMLPPMPMYKHCPEVLIHNTSRAMDAIFNL